VLGQEESLGSNLPLIKCKCGVEILLVPDLKEMGRVIEQHAQLHKDQATNPAKAEIVYMTIQNHLILQVFKRIST